MKHQRLAFSSHLTGQRRPRWLVLVCLLFLISMAAIEKARFGRGRQVPRRSSRWGEMLLSPKANS